MRYVVACLEDYQHEMAYRIYVTEALRNIPQGQWSQKSFYDIINSTEEEAESGDEIVMDIVNRAGLSFG